MRAKPCFIIQFAQFFAVAALIVAIFSSESRAAEDVSAGQLVEQANLYYREGDFQTAAKTYEQAISAGADNGHVYYNLGNAYYRLGQVGFAIANYRKAMLLLPDAPDVQANLSYSRKLTSDKLSTMEERPAIDLSRLLALRPQLSDTQMELLFLTFYWLTFVAIAYYSLQRAATAKYICICLAVVTLILALFTFAVSYGRLGNPVWNWPLSASTTPAVVVSKEVKAHAGDAESFQIVFALHDGAEVMSRNQRSGWTEILLPNGRQGWVRDENIRLVQLDQAQAGRLMP